MFLYNLVEERGESVPNLVEERRVYDSNVEFTGNISKEHVIRNTY